MEIIVKNVLVEVYYSIGIIKHYYQPLQQVYSIIITKISSIKPDLTFKIFLRLLII